MKNVSVLILTAAVITAVCLSGLGAAIAAADSTSNCADTDGGKDYNVKGTANGANGRFVDKCQNPSRVEEYYCEGGKVLKDLHTCDSGCAAGACRGPAGQTSSTGATVSTTSTTLRSTVTTIAAQATTTTIAGQVTTTTLEGGSADGCIDSDGGKNYYAKGMTDGTNGEYFDACLSRGRVREWFCNNGEATEIIFKCEKGCFQAACRGGPNQTITTTTTGVTTVTSVTTTSTTMATTTTMKSAATGTCVDSDGGKDYNTKGIANGANGRFVDKCKSPTLLQEYYCDGALVKLDSYRCDKGCVAGICR